MAFVITASTSFKHGTKTTYKLLEDICVLEQMSLEPESGHPGQTCKVLFSFSLISQAEKVNNYSQKFLIKT